MGADQEPDLDAALAAARDADRARQDREGGVRPAHRSGQVRDAEEGRAAGA